MDRSRSWDCALMLRVINNTWKRINKYLDYPIKLKMKTKTLKFIGPAVLLIFSLFTLAILYLIIEIRLSKYSYHQKVNSRDFEVNSEISKLRFKIQNYRLSTMLNYLQIIQHYIYTDQNYKNHKINEMFWMYDKNTSFPEELFNKIFNINTIIESFSLFNPIIFTFNQIPFAAISKTNGTSTIHQLISSIQYTNSTISRMIKVDENIFNLLCNHDTNFSICYAFTFDLTQNEFISKEFETIHQFSNKKDIVESENLKAKYLFYKQEKSEFKKKYGKMLKNNKIFAWFKSNQKGRQK